MLEFREKRKIRKLVYSPLTIVVLAAIVVVFAKATWDVRAKAAESTAYLQQAQDQLDKVSATQSSLTASVGSLQTRQGVEADIRSQFLVAKPGEQVAVIVDGDPDAGGNDASDTAAFTASASGSAAAASAHAGFWARLAKFFKL